MEEDKATPTVKGISIKWGLIGGLIGIIYFVVLDLIGQSGNQQLQWIGLIISVVIIVLAHKEFKSEGDGYMSYGQGLGIGTLYSFIAALLSNIFIFLYVSFINDDMVTIVR